MSQLSLLRTGGADFSADRRYRYTLWRDLGDNGRQVCFIMCNPSTADADDNDPTVRRCIGYANRWGYGRVVVVNLFAYVSTDPEPVVKYGDVVTGDPQNLAAIIAAAKGSQLVIAAWGAFEFPNKRRPQLVEAMLREGGAPRLYCLGRTAKGHPRHPLYVRADAEPRPYEVPA